MKKWPWRWILVIVGICLIIVGLIPLGECLRLEYAPRPEPLLMQFPLKKGEYTSPPFKSGFHGPCKIDLEWNRSIASDKQIRVNLDWKILDDNGTVISQGAFRYSVAGTTAELTYEISGFRKGQRIVLTLPNDIRGLDETARVEMRVDQDEIALDMSYAGGIALGWAAIVAGPGAIILLVLLIRYYRARSGTASQNSMNAFRRTTWK